MKVVLTTLNAKYIHKNLALRWLYVTSPIKEQVVLKEFIIKDAHEKVLDWLIAQRRMFTALAVIFGILSKPSF